VAVLLGTLLGVLSPPARAASPSGRLAAFTGQPSTTPTRTSGSFDVGPARAALARRIPEHYRQVELVAVPRGDHDQFRVSGRTGHITIEGTSPAVLLTGFGWYLKNIAKADISWNGEQLRLPRALPAPPAPVTRSPNVPHRFALNDTNDGYTGPYRSWADWERELDVLALHGINEVLVYTGADDTYYDTFRDFGYTDQEMRSWIPAPAHQPWWLLQNMSGFGGPVSKSLIDRRAALAKKIINRLRELGMTPVLPGYYGTVPPDFAAKNPGARVVAQGSWGAFQRPDWLDPRNPLFAKVAADFYRHQSERYGDSAMYKMDLLHEGGNPGDVPVGEAATAVQTALEKAHPGAIWAILGWQSNPRPDILSAIDKTKMLILDGLSDRFPSVTDREKDWQGTPYAFGSIWNFGGHTTIGANTPDWVNLYSQWRDKPGSALSGIAMMPEGADNNPAAMALFTELAWTTDPISLDDWFAGYARARYGGDDPHARAAWEVLRNTAYGTTRADSWSEGQDGLFEARPSLTVASAASYSPQQLRYDATAFDQALTELLKVAPALRNNSAYRYDLMDVTRQVLANRSRLLLPQIKAAYDAGDRHRFDELTSVWLNWMTLLDQVIATDGQHLLGRWLADARASGLNTAEKDQLEYDARSIITTWGDRESSEQGLHEYANREWSGLVGGLYYKRWKTYFGELDTALAGKRRPKAIDWFTIDDAWAHGHERYPTRTSGDVYPVSQKITATLAHDTHQTALTAAADKSTIAIGQTVTLTASFTDSNGFAAAQDVRLTPALPEGMTAEPLGAVTTSSVAPGETFTARWKVTLNKAEDQVVAALPVDAAYTVTGSAGATSASAKVMTATGVQPPLKTISFNDAVFGQSGDDIAIEGGGADLWGGTNEFGTAYVNGSLGANATVATKVVTQDKTGNWARAGIIVRNDLTTNGAVGYLNLAVTPANGCVLSWDADGDGRLDSVRQDTSFAAPVYLRLTRKGTAYTAECGTDGTTWQAIGTVTVGSAAATQDAGVFMTAANGWTGTRGIAEFHSLTITGT
jgi:alpha-N-acetylglucosaminidase